MPTKKLYDAAVAVREYTTRDGTQKKQWANVGSVLQFEDGGLCLVLDKHFNPAGVPGEGGVRISFFTPRPRNDQPTPAPTTAPTQAMRPAQTGAPFDDDIPF